MTIMTSMQETLCLPDEKEMLVPVVLLIERELRSRELLCRSIMRHGFRVVEAKTGSEALEKLQQSEGAFDALLVDDSASDINGPEIAEELLARNPDAKIVLINSHSRRRSEFNYLFSPFTFKDILSRISPPG